VKQNKKGRIGGGPRTAAGKAIASRNALRHGFAAQPKQRSPVPQKVERLAQAIAGADADPAILAQALKIAEDELLLTEIAMHKAGILERLHERQENVPDDQDGYNVLKAAIQALTRLDRYVQRACSRQKRAIRELASIRLERRFRTAPAAVNPAETVATRSLHGNS
jgi:hypothetical protein